MLGSRVWRDGLRDRYDEHLATCRRKERPSQPFESWAVNRTWDDFCTVARFALMLREFDRSDWATTTTVPGGSGGGYGSRSLARHALDGLLLVEAVMGGMERRMRANVKRYLLHGSHGRNGELAEARRFVYDWLVKVAEGVESTTRVTNDPY